MLHRTHADDGCVHGSWHHVPLLVDRQPLGAGALPSQPPPLLGAASCVAGPSCIALFGGFDGVCESDTLWLYQVSNPALLRVAVAAHAMQWRARPQILRFKNDCACRRFGETVTGWGSFGAMPPNSRTDATSSQACLAHRQSCKRYGSCAHAHTGWLGASSGQGRVPGLVGQSLQPG
jgi:hypothetical protein